MMKKTIAILGDTGKCTPGLIEVLMKQDLRLLFISENETKNFELKEQLVQVNTSAEVEFTNCEKEGCWEADIIALTQKENISTALVQKIKEVATQKIVLVISEKSKSPEKANLADLLPNSKVIEVQFNAAEKEFTMTGMDEDSLFQVRSIFEKAGYQHKN